MVYIQQHGLKYAVIICAITLYPRCSTDSTWHTCGILCQVSFTYIYSIRRMILRGVIYGYGRL